MAQIPGLCRHFWKVTLGGCGVVYRKTAVSNAAKCWWPRWPKRHFIKRDEKIQLPGIWPYRYICLCEITVYVRRFAVPVSWQDRPDVLKWFVLYSISWILVMTQWCKAKGRVKNNEGNDYGENNLNWWWSIVKTGQLSLKHQAGLPYPTTSYDCFHQE